MRRLLGVLICFGPLGLVGGSLMRAVTDPSSSGAGLILGLLGVLVGGFNFYLSFIRPTFHQWRHNEEEYHHASGAPGVGSILVIAATIFGFGDLRVAILGLVTLIVDSGGLPWFLIMTWKDRAFWGTEIQRGK